MSDKEYKARLLYIDAGDCKEVWEVNGCESALGKVVHTIGYPLQRSFKDRMWVYVGWVRVRYGGGFVYFQEPNLVHIGYARSVVHDHQ